MLPAREQRRKINNNENEALGEIMIREETIESMRGGGNMAEKIKNYNLMTQGPHSSPIHIVTFSLDCWRVGKIGN